MQILANKSTEIPSAKEKKWLLFILCCMTDRNMGQTKMDPSSKE